MNIEVTDDQIGFMLSLLDRFFECEDPNVNSDTLDCADDLRNILTKASKYAIAYNYCNEADRSVDMAQKHLQDSIQHISKIVVDNINGSHQLKSDYKLKLAGTMLELIRIRAKGF